MAHQNMDNAPVEPDSTVEIEEEARRPSMLEYVRMRYRDNYMQCAEMMAERMAERARVRAELQEARAQREALEKTIEFKRNLIEKSNDLYERYQTELRSIALRRHALLRQIEIRRELRAAKQLQLQYRVTQMRALLHHQGGPCTEVPEANDESTS